MWMCKNHPHCYYPRGEKFKLSEMTSEQTANFYRIRLGRREGQTIWIVDGSRVEEDIFPDFIYGGNDQRYRFNPPNDVWIDSRCGIQELEYTIRHELLERDHMLKHGWTYGRAHNAALDLEKGLRAAGLRKLEKRRAEILATPFAYDGRRGLVTPHVLAEAYRMYCGKYRGLKVWSVDGSFVRQFIEPDFCYGGTEKDWPKIIPAGELWLENSLSCEHAHYVKIYHATLRSSRLAGAPHKKAGGEAFIARAAEYQHQRKISLAHELKLPPVRFGVREKGHKTLLEGR